MNKKKLLAAVLIIVVIIQLAFPIGALIKNKTFTQRFEKYGEVYKIRLSGVSYFNNGGEYSYFFYSFKEIGDTFGKRYAVVTRDSEGFAHFELQGKNPSGNNYIKTEEAHLYFSFPSTIDTDLVTQKLMTVNFIDNDTRFSIDAGGYIDMGAENMYLEAKIYDGSAKVLGIYIDGVDAKSVISDLDKNFDTLVSERLVSF